MAEATAIPSVAIPNTNSIANNVATEHGSNPKVGNLKQMIQRRDRKITELKEEVATAWAAHRSAENHF